MDKPASGSETKERRHHPREKAFSLVSFVKKEGDIDKSGVVMGRTLDVSKGGIRIESLEPIEAGTILDMEIALGNQVFSIKGVVVHCRKIKGEQYLVGVKFTDGEVQFPDIHK